MMIISQVVCTKMKNQNSMESQEYQTKWTGYCIDSSALQSPININGPFNFMSMDLDIVFRQMDSGQNYLQNNNNQLVMKGDFGQISQDSTIFSSYEVVFKSPSEHSVGNSQTFFPLEMQVKFVSADQTKLNMAFLFSFGAESDFLNRLGFGRGVLRNLLQNQNFQIPNSFNLQSILPNKNKFFVYKGSDTNPPCEPTIWLIGYDTLKLSQSQLNDFPQALSYQGRDIQRTKQEIFINFNIEKEQEKKEEEEQKEKEDVDDKNIEESDNELHSSKQALNENYTQEEVNQLSKIKDSFILLGDNTIYDPFVYGHGAEPSAKYIKDSDYIVIQKDKPKDLSTMKKEQEIEEIIFKKLSDDQKELDELNNLEQTNSNTKNNKKEQQKDKPTKTAFPAKKNQKDSQQKQFILKNQLTEVDEGETNQTNNGSDKKNDNNGNNTEINKESKDTNQTNNTQDQNNNQNDSNNNQTSNGTPTNDLQSKEEEVIDKLNEQNNKYLDKKKEGSEKYGYNTKGEWDKIPIFSIDEWPKLCKKGKNQSPININPESLMISEDGEINVYYDQLNSHPWLFNDSIKLTLAGKFGTIEYKEHLYDATHVHIHFPSEHTFGEDNERADIEFQIEHKSIYGDKLMVSVLGNLSSLETNPFLESMGISGIEINQHEEIETSKQLKEQLVSLDLLIDSLDDYYRYEGSLTHPPCTEGVTWIVSKNYIQVNKLQLQNLRVLLGLQNNVRGTHDLNGRQIYTRQS